MASVNSQNYIHCYQHGRRYRTLGRQLMNRYHANEHNIYFLPNEYSLYWLNLPSDSEMQRLNTIHGEMRELWQSSVRVPISNPSSILDVGCGSGIWAKEVASILPRAQFIGVDLSPVTMADQPDNLSFQVFDLTTRTINHRSMMSISVSSIPKQLLISSMLASLPLESEIGGCSSGR
jgi:SAM-dependent methyltransferase